MNNRAFNPGDWVVIKYGDYAGHYGKVCMLEKNGNYMIIPYDYQNEPGAMTALMEDSLELLSPLILTSQEFKNIVRGKVNYSEFENDIFPSFNVRPEKAYKMTANDIATALKNINKTEKPLTSFKEWFWLILNVFYKYLKIEGRYNEDGMTDIPANDDEIFSDCFGMTEKLYWRLEERFTSKEDTEKHVVKFDDEPDWDGDELNNDEIEKAAYFAVCEDILSRVDVYKKNKGKPILEWEYSKGQKKLFITACEDAGLKGINREALAKYRMFVSELAAEDDLQALKILAWSHYEGTRAFVQRWSLAEEYLLKVFNLSGDPYAANSLGYIYYYGRVNKGEPQYEEAFKYFSFGALAGIDESIYKCADMLIYGRGTEKNIDMGLNMLIDGYKNSLEAFEFGNYDNRFADYALRMGNVCRDKYIYGMGLRDAYKFYLEAEYAIKKRRETADIYGDKIVEKNIKECLEAVRETVKLDVSRKVLKADFPIYINQLFRDPFPIQVSIKTRNRGNGILTLSRFRLDSKMIKIPLPENIKEMPSVLVCYPELSYCNLVSELTFGLENMEILKKPEGRDFFLSDGFKRNEKTGALEFYSNGELVAALETEKFVIEIKH